MELRHLRYFVTAAEELNISRASARLRISQPAVSRQLRDLEQELGVELFRRGKHGLTLTPAGETFLAHAQDLLRRSNDALKQMEAFTAAAKQTVTIGYITPALSNALTPGLRLFSETYPHVDVALREMHPADQVDALRRGRIDLALIGNPCPEIDREFNVTLLARIAFQAVLPDNHLLALRKRIALSDLEGESFIGFTEDKFPGRNAAICAACQAVGFTPRFRQRVDNLTALLATIAAGKGVTLAPAEVSQLPHPQTVFVSLKPPVPGVLSVALRRKDEQNPLLQALLDSCREAKSNGSRTGPRTGKRSRLDSSVPVQSRSSRGHQ